MPEASSRDCQYLHGFTSAQTRKFVSLGSVSKTSVVLEAMCGLGQVSQELEKQRKGRRHLLDSSRVQIELAKQKVDAECFRVGSVLKIPYSKNYFDAVFIRNGLHEIPKAKQHTACEQIRRVLKPGGRFLNWDIMLNAKNQHLFQDIVRLKDKLAGLKGHVRNRYFMTKRELLQDIKGAGFKKVRFVDIGAHYKISTKKWCEVDFKGNKQKLSQLNKFIRMQPAKSKGIELEDKGDDILIKLPAMISVAVK